MKKIILILFFILPFLHFIIPQDEYRELKLRMVKEQIQARGIKDKKVLEAMREVSRHLFVPVEMKKYAYEDRPLPIGYGQTISQPYIVALMTELLNLNKESRVLEIGTGSGYQAAVLAKIVKEVYTIEIYKELAEIAKEKFQQQGFGNIYTLNADGYYGWENEAPFDAIIVTCAATFVPPPLIKQLRVGGVIAIPVGEPFRVQNLLLIKKIEEGKIETEVITEVIFVPLLRGDIR